MFRGEKLEIFLSGDTTYDLSQIEFSVYLYPDGEMNTDRAYQKSDCILQEDGSYLLSLGPDITKTWPYTSYTVEIHDSSNDVVFMQQHIFAIEPSATGLAIEND